LEHAKQLFEKTQEDFERRRFEVPPPPPIRTKTFADKIRDTRLDLDTTPHLSTKLNMLPQQEQQIKNMSDSIAMEEDDLQFRRRQINLMEKLNAKNGNDMDEEIEAMTNEYLRKFRNLEEKKRKIHRATTLAQQFSTTLTMPDFTPAPSSYRRKPDLLDKKSIL